MVFTPAKIFFMLHDAKYIFSLCTTIFSPAGVGDPVGGANRMAIGVVCLSVVKLDLVSQFAIFLSEYFFTGR